MEGNDLVTEFNPYELLDVEQDASLDEVKAQFKRLTLKYHPDRNRRNENYDPNYYKDICKAYAILKDPKTRRMYDSTFVPHHFDMRQAAEDFIVQQKRAPAPAFGARTAFSSGDLESFNKHFEQNRISNPSDHGYGETMAPRMSESDMQSGKRSNVHVGNNVFGGKKVDAQTFNKRFEEQGTPSGFSQGGGLIEASDAEPMGFGLMDSSGSFSDVSVYDGMVICGRETQDYGQYDMGSNLSYSDYQKGFTNFVSGGKQLQSDAPMSSSEMERMMGERRAELTKPVAQLDKRNQKKNFQEQLSLFEQEKERQLKYELEQQKALVFKYKNQYPEHMLGTSRNRRSRPQMDRPQMDRPQMDRPHMNRPQMDRPQMDRPHMGMNRPIMREPQDSHDRMFIAPPSRRDGMSQQPHPRPQISQRPRQEDGRTNRNFSDFMEQRMNL